MLISDPTAEFCEMSSSSNSSLRPRGVLQRKDHTIQARLPYSPFTMSNHKRKTSSTPAMSSKDASSAVEKSNTPQIKNSSAAKSLPPLLRTPTGDRLTNTNADSKAKGDQVIEWTVYGRLQWKDGVISKLDEVNTSECNDGLDGLDRDLNIGKPDNDQNDHDLDEDWEIIAAEN
jgi:hypothetical protein